MRLAASTSPVHVAWAAYDRTMLALHDLYRRSGELRDTTALRSARLAKAQEAVELWAGWRDLYLESDQQRPAA